MKARDLAKYILSLPEEQQELDVIVLESGYEYEEGIGDLEAYETEITGSWNSITRQYEVHKGIKFLIKEPEKPIQGEVIYDEEATKELQSNLLRPNEGLMF